ncbi:MAG: hypothetical protein Kow0080_24260 [Candidatus Promineifilaceae bacterium]
MNDYLAWPFYTFEQRAIEDNEQWWQYCYVPAPAVELITTVPQWTLLVGGAGTGKSVTLQALQRAYADQIFFVNYPPTFWPGGLNTPHPQEASHFPQMLSAAALAIRDYLATNPEAGKKVTAFEIEFLQWLFTNYIGPRAFFRVSRYFSDELVQAVQAEKKEDLLSQTTENLMVQSQIDELVCVVQAFGFSHLVFVADLAYPGTQAEKAGAADLFGWLELTHHPGFAVITAVPDALLGDGIVLSRARGRARVIRLQWTHESCRQVAERHIHLATEGAFCLADLVDDATLAFGNRVVEEAYDAACPQGWVEFAETVLYLKKTQSLKRPFTKKEADLLMRTFFARHVPLKIDAEAGAIWRGPKRIHLDEQPMALVQLLFVRRGHPINWEDEGLRRLAGSKDNVYSIARRARLAIEPVPQKPVYLVNKRGEGGYWLENLMEL